MDATAEWRACLGMKVAPPNSKAKHRSPASVEVTSMKAGRESPHTKPISKIFSSEYQFSIPDYQRPYSWAIEQALHLLEDLEDALDH